MTVQTHYLSEWTVVLSLHQLHELQIFSKHPKPAQQCWEDFFSNSWKRFLLIQNTKHKKKQKKKKKQFLGNTRQTNIGMDKI